MKNNYPNNGVRCKAFLTDFAGLLICGNFSFVGTVIIILAMDT